MTNTDANIKEILKVWDKGGKYELLIKELITVNLTQFELNILAQAFDIYRTDKTEKP